MIGFEAAAFSFILHYVSSLKRVDARAYRRRQTRRLMVTTMAAMTMVAPRRRSKLPESVARPEYATVVGLVLHAAKTRRTNSHKGNTLVSKLKSMFAGA